MTGIIGRINLTSDSDKINITNIQQLKESYNLFPYRGGEKVIVGDGRNLTVLVQKHPYEKWIIGEQDELRIIALGDFTNLKGFDKQVRYTQEDELLILTETYKKYNMEFSKKVEGNNMILIYDTAEDTIFFTKNFFSAIPFYYSLDNNIFSFASEVKGILAMFSDNHFKIRRSSIVEHLIFMDLACDHTMFENIFKLQQGEAIQIKKNSVKRQFNFPDALYGKNKNKTCTIEEALEIMKKGLESVVRERERERRACD